MFCLIGLYSDYLKQEKTLNLQYQKEITKTHKEAVADLVVNKMVDGRKIENIVSAISSLFESGNEADVFSLAMQKAGLSSPVMAGAIANKLFNKPGCNFITVTKVEGK